jgi:hypothetical protein
MKAAVALLMFSVAIVAQAPRPSPCSAAELKLAMAEARALAAETKAEARALRLETLQRENAQQRALIGTSAQGLAAELKKTSILTAAQDEAQRNITALKQSIAEQQLLIVRLATQRDALTKKIAKANGTKLCELFHLGCVSER